jgi:hypothetical protein
MMPTNYKQEGGKGGKGGKGGGRHTDPKCLKLITQSSKEAVLKKTL